MDSAYIDSLLNKLYELEDCITSLNSKKTKDLALFFVDSIYPLWTDLDSGLTSIEKNSTDEEILSMRIRLDACQVKILHTISPYIESSIELLQNEDAANDVYRVISLIERISKNEGNTLSVLLKQKKHSIQIKQKLNELHHEGEEIYKKFKETLNNSSIPSQEKLNILEKFLVHEDTSLQRIKNVFDSTLNEQETVDKSFQKWFEEINRWYDECEKDITPFRQKMDVLPTYLVSEEYEKCFQIINNAKNSLSEGNEVNSYASDDLDDISMALMDVDKAEIILRRRWKKFSINKYIKYQNEIETRLSGGDEDPRNIQHDFDQNISKNLMPIDEIEWDSDQKKTYLRVLDQLNKQVVLVKNIDKNIQNALNEPNPITGLRLLIAENERIKNKSYLDSFYQDSHNKLVERGRSYIEDQIKEIRLLFERNLDLSIAIDFASKIKVEISGLKDFSDQFETIELLQKVAAEASTMISGLSADPQKALESLESLKVQIEESGISVPLAIETVVESCHAVINPQEIAQQLINEINLPESISDIESSGLTYFQGKIPLVQNALEGMKKTKIAWQAGEVEREQILHKLEFIITKLEAARDYLYANEELKRDKKDILRIENLLDSAQRLDFLVPEVSNKKQQIKQIATADKQIDLLLNRIERNLKSSSIKLETLYKMYKDGIVLGDQPSYKVTELNSAMQNLQEILKKRLNKEFAQFIQNPKEFISEIKNVENYIIWAKDIAINIEGDAEGALFEAKAWASYEKNTPESSHWQETLHFWTQAELHSCKESHYHKLACLKALAIVESIEGIYSTLPRLLQNSIFRNDHDVAVLYAKSLLEQFESKYQNPRNLKELTGTSEFNHIKKPLSMILGFDFENSNSDFEEDESEVLTYNQIWSKYYYKKVPSLVQAQSLSIKIERRKELYADLVSIANKMRVDASIKEFYNGVSLAAQAGDRLNSADQRIKLNKENAVLFNEIWKSFREYTFEELRK